MPPGNGLIKPVSQTLAKPKPLGYQGGIDHYTPPAPAPVAAPAAAPPVDFSTLVGSDPQYTREQALLKQQQDQAMRALQQGFAQQSQGYQDQANSHGALFSGAAVHAQQYAAQQASDQAAQQGLNYSQNAGNSLSSAWQRILNQLAGVQ